MKVIFGLGNPGPEYRLTRHNLGFRVLDALRSYLLPPQLVQRRHYARCWLHRLPTEDLWRVRPSTFMNRSGFAVRAFLQAHPEADLDDILVVCDDLSLPLGTVRLRPKGSPGGHRGLESIVNLLKTMDFPRLRLGIRPPHLEYIAAENYSDFVLSPFEKHEEPIVEEMVQKAARVALSWATVGIQRTMSRFNS